MKNNQIDMEESTKAALPEEIRLWVKYKPEAQRISRKSGEPVKTWSWDTKTLSDSYFKALKKETSVYRLIQWKFSLIRHNCEDIRVYDCSVRNGPMLYHWTIHTGLISNEMRLMSYREQDQFLREREAQRLIKQK